MILAIHIAGGITAIGAGAIAATVRKGGSTHRRSGTVFAAAMLLLGLTATLLDWMKVPAEPGLGGLVAVYFVVTSWAAARRRDESTGWVERIACALALGTGAVMLWSGLTPGGATTPVGQGPVIALGGLCLLAGLLDVNYMIRGKDRPANRIVRHLWRICFAFFIATGSFFLGQQDVMPAALRGSPILLLLAFAPLALLAFWIFRLRIRKLGGQPLLRRWLPGRSAVPL